MITSEQRATVSPGEPAPDFALPAVDGTGTVSLAERNTENVGVSPPLICVSAVGAAGCRQTPVTGSLRQIVTASGRIALPVLVDAVMSPEAPTLTVATENAPTPPVTLAMPSPLIVAASATMSGTGVAEADRSSVLRPTMTGAGSVLAHA